ncbi:MAG: hypothetical protein KF869_11575 [Phycisphaeraceae bacterium]|nr:hypothetical protein [Phycisphaeraceae bacterium]
MARAIEHGWLDAVPVIVLRPALWWERERAEQLYRSHVAIHKQGLFRREFIRMPGGPAQGPGPVAAAQPTQWERLLIAFAVSRRLAADVSSVERTGDLGVLQSLGRDARPAHAAMRRALHREPSSEIITAVIQLTKAGDRGMRTDLKRLLNAKLDEAERRRVLAALIEVEFGEGKFSAPIRAAIRYQPCDAGEIQKWVHLCNGGGEPSDVMIDLVTMLLRRSDEPARRAAMTPVLLWTRAGHWSEPLAESLWQEEANHDTLALVAYMIAGSAVDLDKWGPRLLELVEHPSAVVRSGALNALYHRATGHAWRADDLDRWLAALDRSKPRAGSGGRQKRAWILEHLGGAIALEPVVITSLANAVSATRDDVISLLMPIAVEGMQPRSRRAAIVGMAEIGLDTDAAHALAARIWSTEANAYVRATVIDSLVRPNLAVEQLQDLLHAALNESDSVVLVIAVQVASELENPSPSVVSRLEELAHSESDSVAFMSRRSLATIRERSAVKINGTEAP